MMNFLYLGALITIAAAIQQNWLAMWLAFAAAALAFVRVRIVLPKRERRASFFPPSLLRGGKKEGTKNRASRTLAYHGETRMNISRISDAAAQAAANIVQKGVLTVKQVCDPGEFGSNSVNLGCNTALCCLMPIVPFLAKRPVLSHKEIEEKGAEELVKLMNYETVLYASLIVSRMHHDSDMQVHEKRGSDVSVAATVKFGPHVMNDALNDWKKLTGKNPADYFDPNLLEGLAAAERNSLSPFESFLAGRKPGHSSSTLN